MERQLANHMIDGGAKMESRVIPPDHASARQTEMGETFNRVLFSALDALQERKIPYALIGGIAASGLGRPRSTHDIDVFVRPEDADAALEALGRRGFETEKTDKRWLYKGWMDEMMVDIIFKSSGDIYFDDEMQRRVRPIQYHGRSISAVAPEDLIIIKAAVHSEVGPHHWHDALAILSHAQLDWTYLIKRARRAPRRLLALLIYAQSNDIWIPNGVIVDLFQSVFGEALGAKAGQAGDRYGASSQIQREATPAPAAAARTAPPAQQQPSPARSPDAYLVGHIHEQLAQNSATAALDIQLTVGSQKVLVKGEVQNEDQRRAIEQVIRGVAQGHEVDNQVRLTEYKAPETEEVV